MRRLTALVVLLVACSDKTPAAYAPTEGSELRPAPRAIDAISIVGTNDLHGRIDALPILGGYLENLRSSRGAEGVLLLDAGDMFQGTLESNLSEGEVVVEAYAALGYDAAAIGNHELDYGPVGSATTGDPQGALEARIRQAKFAMLSANLVTTAGKTPSWPGLSRSVLIERGGRRIGVIGAITEETPSIVMRAYFAGLAVQPIAESVRREATSLRQRGAELVVLLAHAGGTCERFDDPHDLSSCKQDSEIFSVVRALERGTVDVVIAGHTHRGVAHEVQGVPVLEAYAHGRAFSRIDVGFGSARPSFEIHPPRDLCAPGAAFSACNPGSYEDRAVARNARLDELIAPAVARANEKRAQKIGITLAKPVTHAYGEPSALGNLFADLLREAVPGADVGIMNGGGLRATLPAGELEYGELYEAMPFDNALAVVRLSGAELRRVIAAHLENPRHGILSLSGITARARCDAGKLVVELFQGKKPIRDDASLRVVISDYLATGGDELLAPVTIESSRIEFLPELMRDALARRLAARGGTLDASRVEQRMVTPRPRPLRCEQP